MKNNKSAAKVQQTANPSLAELLKKKAENSNFYRVAIPVENILEFDPQNPVTEEVLVFGRPRKVLRWNVKVDGKEAVAVLQVGQVARLYQAIMEENLPEGVSLSDAEQAVIVLTDKFTVDARDRKQPNGSAGFLNLSPLTVKATGSTAEVSGFQFA